MASQYFGDKCLSPTRVIGRIDWCGKGGKKKIRGSPSRPEVQSAPDDRCSLHSEQSRHEAMGGRVEFSCILSPYKARISGGSWCLRASTQISRLGYFSTKTAAKILGKTEIVGPASSNRLHSRRDDPSLALTVTHLVGQGLRKMRGTNTSTVAYIFCSLSCGNRNLNRTLLVLVDALTYFAPTNHGKIHRPPVLVKVHTLPISGPTETWAECLSPLTNHSLSSTWKSWTLKGIKTRVPTLGATPLKISFLL